MPITLNGTTGIDTPGLESTGMPTVSGSAVVESGSNSDGEWTRWADGTQLCWTDAAGEMDTNTASGSIYRASTLVVWTYPVAFVGVPHANPGLVSSSARWAATQSTQATDSTFNMFGPGASAIATPFSAAAKGRWK